MKPAALLLFLLGTTAVADTTPYSVATLAGNADEAAVTEAVTPALQSPAPLVRATAARVVAVRGLKALLPQLRERVAAETDGTAAREQIRALALLGTEEDIALAAQSAARWPASMDDALAVAVARRGDRAVIDSWLSTLRKTRMRNTTEFFRVAFWGRAGMIAVAGSRMLAGEDARGWSGVLYALEESSAAMSDGVMAASLGSRSEDIRAASLWFLVRSYAADPQKLPELVKTKLAPERTELSSNREDFGLELLRRMLGGEKKDSPRWQAFLGTEEADLLLQRSGEVVLQYLTDEEYRVHYDRCAVQVRACALPPKRSGLTIPSQPVSPPAFNLPELLPAGLAQAVLSGARCNESWAGVARASVDPAGRVAALDLEPLGVGRACRSAIDTLLRLAFATNTSVRSTFSGAVLLVHAARAPLCLDEDPPRDQASTILHAGGAVEPPVVKKRVEPQFPAPARAAMGSGRNVIIILESVISKDGCVRSVRLLSQSPYPDLNGAAVLALSQWTFLPGRLDGQPVDVIFNLTVNFKTGF